MLTPTSPAPQKQEWRDFSKEWTRRRQQLSFGRLRADGWAVTDLESWIQNWCQGSWKETQSAVHPTLLKTRQLAAPEIPRSFGKGGEGEAKSRALVKYLMRPVNTATSLDGLTPPSWVTKAYSLKTKASLDVDIRHNWEGGYRVENKGMSEAFRQILTSPAFFPNLTPKIMLTSKFNPQGRVLGNSYLETLRASPKDFPVKWSSQTILLGNYALPGYIRLAIHFWVLNF